MGGIAVAEDFHLFAVTVAEDWLHTAADDVGMEIGRDIADADLLIGVGSLSWGRMNFLNGAAWRVVPLGKFIMHELGSRRGVRIA